MNIEIREVSESDLTAIHKLVSPSFGRTNHDELKDQSLGILSFIVAWVNSIPTGYGFVCWGGARSSEVQRQKPGIPEFYRLTVQDDSQCKGIGTQMIKYMELLAQKKGIGSLGLGVSHQNTRAYELYKRLGYSEIIPEYYDEYKYSRDGVIMKARERCRYMSKTICR